MLFGDVPVGAADFDAFSASTAEGQHHAGENCQCPFELFPVGERRRFERWCNFLNLRYWTRTAKWGETFYAIGTDNGCGWPTRHPEVYRDIDFIEELQKRLDLRDIAVLFQTQNEGLNYISGVAVAVNADGRFLHFNF